MIEQWPFGQGVYPGAVVEEEVRSWRIENRFKPLLDEERNKVAAQRQEEVPPVSEGRHQYYEQQQRGYYHLALPQEGSVVHDLVGGIGIVGIDRIKNIAAGKSNKDDRAGHYPAQERENEKRII